MNDRLIVPLDFPRLSPALDLVRKLGTEVPMVKVGLQLFTASGPDALQSLRSLNKRVFLDLKLHDIPNTVAGAVGAAAHWGVDLLTLHAEGGSAMMRAAREARDASPHPSMKLLAVTVLTSLDGSEYPEVYRSPNIAERVTVFARAAVASGMDGVVCSVHELEVIKPLVPEGFLLVTPGIRMSGGDAQDQARVSTPQQALARGATHLVVGRAITADPNPVDAARRVLEEMRAS